MASSTENSREGFLANEPGGARSDDRAERARAGDTDRAEPYDEEPMAPEPSISESGH
jgi:hypothetical protein